MSRLVIDPVARIGGHLRIEADIVGGAVDDAWCAGTMYRGIESILRGRDPRDAWLLAQRVCGTCAGVHALASVRAVENALAIKVPKNARLLRNLISGSTIVGDHVMQFYLHQAPDWADAASALTADPTSTAALARTMSDAPSSTPDYFRTARDKLAVLVQSGPLSSGYWGHPAYHLPPELNLVVFAHYLEALDWQRQLIRMRTILGGKSPHPQTYLVGGMAVAPEWGGPDRPTPGEHPWRAARHSPPPLSSNGLADIADLITQSSPFISDAFLPDVLALGAWYPEWQQFGAGHGHYLAFGEFAQDDVRPSSYLLPAGRIMDRNLSDRREVGQTGVAEAVSRSWYDNAGVDDLIHPSVGQTRPKYSGPRPPFQNLDTAGAYSWLKAPRYEDDPMEVGALARLAVGYGAGLADIRTAVDAEVGQLELGQAALFSTLGRTLARAIEAKVLALRLGGWVRELVANMGSGDLALADLSQWDAAQWPAEATGWAFAEGPRGAVGHWLTIRDRRIAEYQIVDASTWNGSPRDSRGRRGACEEALVGTPVADGTRPLEILRTVHSFAICPACAVH